MISSLNFYSVAFAVDLKRHFSWHLYAVLIIAHHSYFVAVFFIAATLPFLPFFATALTVSLCAECWWGLFFFRLTHSIGIDTLSPLISAWDILFFRVCVWGGRPCVWACMSVCVSASICVYACPRARISLYLPAHLRVYVRVCAWQLKRIKQYFFFTDEVAQLPFTLHHLNNIVRTVLRPKFHWSKICGQL